MHNGITFSTGISIGFHDRDIVTEVQCQDSVPFSTVPKYSVTNGNVPLNMTHFGAEPSDSTTNGNRARNIVSHLVPDQVIAL